MRALPSLREVDHRCLLLSAIVITTMEADAGTYSPPPPARAAHLHYGISAHPHDLHVAVTHTQKSPRDANHVRHAAALHRSSTRLPLPPHHHAVPRTRSGGENDSAAADGAFHHSMERHAHGGSARQWQGGAVRALLQQLSAAAAAEHDVHGGGGEAIRVKADDTATMAAVWGGCTTITITVDVVGTICLTKRVKWWCCKTGV